MSVSRLYSPLRPSCVTAAGPTVVPPKPRSKPQTVVRSSESLHTHTADVLRIRNELIESGLNDKTADAIVRNCQRVCYELAKTSDIASLEKKLEEQKTLLDKKPEEQKNENHEYLAKTIQQLEQRLILSAASIASIVLLASDQNSVQNSFIAAVIRKVIG